MEIVLRLCLNAPYRVWMGMVIISAVVSLSDILCEFSIEQSSHALIGWIVSAYLAPLCLLKLWMRCLFAFSHRRKLMIERHGCTSRRASAFLLESLCIFLRGGSIKAKSPYSAYKRSRRVPPLLHTATGASLYSQYLPPSLVKRLSSSLLISPGAAWRLKMKATNVTGVSELIRRGRMGDERVDDV